MNTPAPLTGRSPWPYAIAVWMTLFATGVAGFIVFAQGHRMDLVAADYYEQEIRYQGRIDSVDRARALRKEAAVEYANGSLRITLPTEHANRHPSGTVHLYRPSNAKLDQHIKLAVGASAEQRLDAKSLLPGLWRVRVAWTVGADEFFHEDTVIVGP